MTLLWSEFFLLNLHLNRLHVEVSELVVVPHEGIIVRSEVVNCIDSSRLREPPCLTRPVDALSLNHFINVKEVAGVHVFLVAALELRLVESQGARLCHTFSMAFVAVDLNMVSCLFAISNCKFLLLLLTGEQNLFSGFGQDTTSKTY